ncbi:magnesium transporter MRS2-4-like [Wolffia australiana]
MGRKKGSLTTSWKKFSRRWKIAGMPTTSGDNGGIAGNVQSSGIGPISGIGAGGVVSKGGKKKTAGSRLWMRFDRSGETQIFECDKSVIIQRAGLPPRDLRILGPVFSRSSNIVAREKAMVVNLEVVSTIITAHEVLLLDPLNIEVRPFVDQLRQQLASRKTSKALTSEIQENGIKSPENAQLVQRSVQRDDDEVELPFEFQVLEIAFEVVCSYLESSVSDLEKNAYPCLDELAKNVSTKNLERVRGLKANLTRLLARVQKVRDEIEHLLDDDDDMADFYLTRKHIQNQQAEALLVASASNNVVPLTPYIGRLNSYHRTTSIVNSVRSDLNDVEDLEMLLEAYFMQLDGTRNRILSVREYIDDTEDYVNIQLDNQRNELIQLQVTLYIATLGIILNTFIVGLAAMNIPSPLYQMNNLFGPFVGATSSACVLIFLLILGYARWKKLIG